MTVSNRSFVNSYLDITTTVISLLLFFSQNLLMSCNELTRPTVVINGEILEIDRSSDTFNRSVTVFSVFELILDMITPRK